MSNPEVNTSVWVERNEGLNRIAMVCPNGGSIGVKVLQRGKDVNGNTRLLVSYLVAFEGKVLSLDLEMSMYFQHKRPRGAITGLWVGKDDALGMVHTIALDLYGEETAIWPYFI